MIPFLSNAIDSLAEVVPYDIVGRVAAVTGLTIRATGLPVPVGASCEVQLPGGTTAPAEAIGFCDDLTVLMPLTSVAGIAKGQPVRCVTARQRVAVGPALLGRVIDALGRPMNELPAAAAEDQYLLHRPAPPALRRRPIDQALSVGVRSINALLTPGRGQRLGIFSGTGVGKSVLLGMMARHTSADVVVVTLVGERGREVSDFLSRDLGEAGLKRCVVVVSTSDQSPALRVRAPFTATAVAEYFRDQGADVLLLMDSITRMAMSQRQIGLAAGEPPTTKGYTPSVFTLLPQLLERAGRTNEGSITGLYTVLVEGDDLADPIADTVRGILDGHIVLSRKIAMRGQYPAVSILESISRTMPDVVDAAHLERARRVQRLMAIWEDISDLVHVGAYAAGTSAEYDLAIAARPWIEGFLRQDMNESVSFEAACEALLALDARISEAEAAARRASTAPAAGQPSRVADRRTPAGVDPSPEQKRVASGLR